MNEDEVFSSSETAARESLIQHFAISGLFGYRTLSLDSEYAATILIARNGAGKTTMLGAMDAFLRCQFGRLAELDFQRIECKLRNVDELLILDKKDLDNFVAMLSDNSEILKIAKIHELAAIDVLYFVFWEYPTLAYDSQELMQHPVFAKVYNHSAHTLDSTRKTFNSILESINKFESPIISLRKSILSALADIEIVYLPTYRRIELSLPEADEPRYLRHRPAPSIQTRLGLTGRGLHAANIQFGLSDISARLRSLNQEIMIESNQKYAEISANIIEDLISGTFENQHPSLADRPTLEELDIFFGRLRSGSREWGFYGPYQMNKIPDFGRIYSGNIPPNSEKFLTYFLGKLNSVIQKTRNTQSVVEKFIASCNRYLSAADPTTDRYDYSNLDGKVLKLDRASLEVSVWRSKPDREIPLDALSSGEKQMISLFARLYLYPKEKLVLIDEPELSLSIDWQRKILPDILNSSICKQVVAITHSPFIFDNELDAFAKALRIEISDNGGLDGV